MFNSNKYLKHLKIFKDFNLVNILAVFIFVVIIFKASAGSVHLPGIVDHNVRGYAWNFNTGYISFNCLDENICADSNYGLDVTPTIGTGNFSGQVWSRNNGWISFDRTGANATGNPPEAPFNTGTGTIAQVNWSTGKVIGWARILNQINNPDDGKGWIQLSDATSTNGVNINPITGKFSGYAWGGYEGVGWIDMSPIEYQGQVGKELKVTIAPINFASSSIAQLYLDTDPNYLSWKCLNASESSDGVVTSSILSGRALHNDSVRTLICKNLANAQNPNGTSTATYNPSSLTLTQPATTTVSINYTCPTLSTRVKLLKNTNQLDIPNTIVANTTVNYTDTNVVSGQTYTYKLSCFKNQNNLLAYSQKTFKVGTGLIAPANPDPGPVSCSYQAGTNSVNCINIPICSSSPTVYATQINMTTNSDPISSNTGSTSTYLYSGNNTNIYQYNFVCPIGNNPIIPSNPNTYIPIKILPAVVPPYSHFLNFNVSSALVQVGGTVNLNWNIQSPTSTCLITPKHIKSDGELLNLSLLDFIAQQSNLDSTLSKKIKGDGINMANANGSQKLTIDKSTRLIASCREGNPNFSSTILGGTHYIIRDVYVIKEAER